MSPSQVRLADSIWLQIFGFLNDSRTLLNLELHVGGQLGRVASDFSLWRHVNVVDVRSKEDFRRFVHKLNAKTLSIRLKAAKKRKKADVKLSSAFLRSVKLRCPNLRSLTLRDFAVCCLEWPFIDLPAQSLETLSLRGSHLNDLPRIRSLTTSPHFPLKRRLFKLRTLDLRDCGSWLKECDIRAAKLLPALETLLH